MLRSAATGAQNHPAAVSVSKRPPAPTHHKARPSSFLGPERLSSVVCRPSSGFSPRNLAQSHVLYSADVTGRGRPSDGLTLPDECHYDQSHRNYGPGLH